MSKTRIRTHKFQDAKMCPRVLANDANALYPNTMDNFAIGQGTSKSLLKFCRETDGLNSP